MTIPQDPYGLARRQAGGQPGGTTPSGGWQQGSGSWQQNPSGSWQAPYGGSPQTEAQGGPGDEPPKSKTGLWVGLGIGAVALLAIGALLFTGFVAPGFFLSDPEDVAHASPSTSTEAPTSSAPPTTATGTPGAAMTIAQDFVDKLNGGDKDGSLALSCYRDLMESTVTRAITDQAIVKIKSTTPSTATFLSLDLEGDRGGRPGTGSLSVMSRDNGTSWCVMSLLFF